MKTTLTLIYDKDCPLCSWYTGAFVRYGFLPAGGRIAWAEAIENDNLSFDRELSRNKIALIDRAGGTTIYGLDSLLAVIGGKYPLVEKFAKLPVIHFILRGLYSFVSYNRKMVAPSDSNVDCSCTPSASIGWRLAFITFCGLTVNLATGLYFTQQLGAYFTGHPVYTDLVLFTAQFGFQLAAFKLLKQQSFADYAGNLAFVSFLGALLLLFFHLGLNVLAAFGLNVEMLQPLCYGIVYLFMLYEHSRRLRLLHLSKWLGVSWILYRFIIYPFAFTI
jgi:hypothetical protein